MRLINERIRKAVCDLYYGTPYCEPAVLFRAVKFSPELPCIKHLKCKFIFTITCSLQAVKKLSTDLGNFRLFYFTLYCQYYKIKSMITLRQVLKVAERGENNVLKLQ